MHIFQQILKNFFSRSSRVVLVALGSAVCQELAIATSPPAPPPPTIAEMVQGSTLIVQAKGMELYRVTTEKNGKNVTSIVDENETDKPGGYFLRATVVKQLYCSGVCPKEQKEIFIFLQLNSDTRQNVGKTFLNRTYIFLLANSGIRNSDMPIQARGRWHALGFSSSFISSEKNDEVEKLVRALKSTNTLKQ